MSSASFYAAKGQSEWLRTRHRLVQGDSLQSTATEEERKGISHHFLTTPARIAPEDDSVGQNGRMPNPPIYENVHDTVVDAGHVEPSVALDSQLSRTQSARAFDELLAQYRALSDSERMKGNLFEQLVRQYLLNDAQMRLEFQEVYLWKDWPGNQNLPDTGIDLVGVLRDRDGEAGDAVAIQCKFYSTSHRIQKSDIDSFLSESGKHPYQGRIIVETTGEEWSSNAKNAIEGQQIPVSAIGLTDLRNSDIDWSTYRLETPEAGVEHLERKSLRDHQVNAIRDVFDGFKESDRGTLVMACGTGKTFTSLKIAEKLAENNDGSARVLFMVPSLALMSQTLGEWATECEVPFHAWSVCSDIKVNRRRANQEDIADISITDLKTPPTTDPRKLVDSLSRSTDDGGLQVVFATYQSIDVVAEAQELGGSSWRDFDLIICDEAHRTTGVTLSGEDESSFVKVHDNDLIRADRRLYMTATPRLFKPEVKNAAKEKDAVLSSMDDEAIYGPVFHKLGFGQAVSLGLLTDYKVVVLAVPEDQVSGIYQNQTADGGELNLPEIAKLAGVWNALAKRKSGTLDISYGDDLTPMRRAVAFAKDIKTSKWVADEFPALVANNLQDLTNDDTSDNLGVEARHVDGTMNAIVRGEALDWLKEDLEEEEEEDSFGLDAPTCRILTNARCLTEGVDVPSLDAVIFLNPRKSQVDVIQAVGRVMRKAPNKNFGYVVLPIAIPFGMTPEEALSDNERYKVIWQVLQALRAHDERFDATINSIGYNTGDPTSILVDIVDLTKKKPVENHLDGSAKDSDDHDGGGNGTKKAIQGAFAFSPVDWKDAVYSRIVKKVGDRLYWDDWSKDIADIASRYISLIDHLLEDLALQDTFGQFVESLKQILNPSIDGAQAVEMLAQHLITKPLFDAMFEDQSFAEQNPVSRAMQGVLDAIGDNDVFVKEREPLEAFYTTMVARIKEIDNIAGKQEIMRTLYDNFFSKAFPQMSDRLGIVFTPVPVVDYILHSANDALKQHFGMTLGDPGVDLLEPFLGTGTFISRLLSSGIIKEDQLEHKYKHEIFGNEIVLLSYYIASINIENTYRQVRAEQGYPDEYTEFEGIALTDTFQLHESDDKLDSDGFDFAENIERLKRQRQARIKVIVMNPPYSGKQASANDNNQNLDYPRLNARIESTYALKSTASSKVKLYDSYYRALRWATDRIGTAGVLAFVSNNSFLDDNSAAGVRLTLQDEFSDIYIYNLRGGVRGKRGDTAKREGGNVFPIMTGVAITVLVKRESQDGPVRIHYMESDDYLTAQEKIDLLLADRSITGTFPLGEPRLIRPNGHGDWISQRDETFTRFQPLGDKTTKGKEVTPGIFRQYSLGLNTNRDSWCYNFSETEVAMNVSRMIDNYNSQRESHVQDFDPTKVAWSSSLESYFKRGLEIEFEKGRIRKSIYRPFCCQYVYFDQHLNHRTGQLPQLFPSPNHPNLAIGSTQDYRKPWSHLMTELLADLNMLSATQFFSLYTWRELPSGENATPSLLDLAREGTFSGTFDFSHSIHEQVPELIDGYERLDNITDATLRVYRDHYGERLSPEGEQIAKEDIFFYIYALLHHPDYRERYEADLKKMLPRIPMVPEFWEYSNIGRELAELHVSYETIEPYPLTESWALDAPTEEWQRYRVEKLAWGKKGKDKDTSRLIYNDYLTFSDIPAEINDYQIGGRSPLEWMIDRYKMVQDKKSGIVNDPNDYFREVGQPRYLADLIKSLVTVTMRTIELTKALPEFIIEEDTK